MHTIERQIELFLQKNHHQTAMLSIGSLRRNTLRRVLRLRRGWRIVLNAFVARSSR